VKTVHLLTCEAPDFIVAAPWSANSSDLSLVDYRIWRQLQQRVYLSRIDDVAHEVAFLSKSGNISSR